MVGVVGLVLPFGDGIVGKDHRRCIDNKYYRKKDLGEKETVTEIIVEQFLILPSGNGAYALCFTYIM